MHVITIYLILSGFINVLFQKRFVKKYLAIVLGIILFIIAALRSPNFGPDSQRYISAYESLKYLPMKYLWENLIFGHGKDPFFDLFSKVVSSFGISSQIWLACIAGFFSYSVTRLIYLESDDSYISFIVLISLGYLFFSFTGLRQTLAISFVLFSYRYMKERKLLPFLICLFFAYLFHATALIFLIAYPFTKIKIGVKHILIASIIFSLAFFQQSLVRQLVFLIGWTDNISGYATRGNALTMSGFVIQLFVFVFCFIHQRASFKVDFNRSILLCLSFLGLSIQLFSSIIAEFFRISMYFSIFNILLIANTISTIKNVKYKILVYYLVLFALIGYIFWSQAFQGFSFYFS